MTLHDDAVATLTDWPVADIGQRALREAFLGFLAARPDGVYRSCAPGHVTASAVVVDPTLDRVLLTLHPRVGRWVQLGGHCESADPTLVAAALREATEESGIPGLVIDPVPLHLDVHPITCSLGVPTRHFDVRFLLTAPAGSTAAISSESLALRWFGYDELPVGVDTVPVLVALARARCSGRTALASSRRTAR